MTVAQDIYIDLMHVLYVYSRVIRGGGGELQSIVGGQIHVCICGILDIYKTHAVQ